MREPLAAEGIGWFAATVLGIVEGVTEFLPISSTGHLIVANAMLGASDPAFEVAIQVGAISAIAVLYRRRLWQAGRALFGAEGRKRVDGSTNLWWLLVVAAIPAAVVGLAFEETIGAVLFAPMTVAVALLVGGVLLLLLERWLAARPPTAPPLRNLDTMRVRDAFWIGVFQCLALVPGTSRSGATIAGALLLRFDRVAAAEFSFLVGLPVLYGACLLKLAKDYDRFAGPLLLDFAIACLVSFVTAYVVVGPFVRFLQAHTFRIFGWYRVFAGVALLALIAAGVLDSDSDR